MTREITTDAIAEEVAVFRMQVLGGLARRELARGQLKPELRALSKDAFLVPGVNKRQRFSVPTLERWYYALRKYGLPGLRPRVRTDRGRARALTDEQKKLCFDIRCEFPQASATLILQTLERQGRVDTKIISATTLRRYFAQEGVQKEIAQSQEKAPRMRWEAERAGTLFHSDVHHGPKIRIGDRMMPTRIHAILDDASRYIVAIRVAHTERESDMLRLIVGAWRAYGISDLLYLDNGSTYRGQVLDTACARIGTTLIHAKPYTPESRGKMERFWRTLRPRCLDYIKESCSLEDLHNRLQAYVEKDYHKNAHAGLMGKTPGEVWAERSTKVVTEAQIAAALTVHQKRTVNGDNTISLGGVLWETQQNFLARKKVSIGRTLLDFNTPPWVEYDGKKYELRRVDAVANGKTRRCPPPKSPTGVDVLFDPTQALLDFGPAEDEGES